MTHRISLPLLTLAATLLACACTDDLVETPDLPAAPAEGATRTVEVPYAIEVSGGWTVDEGTRVAPPGIGGSSDATIHTVSDDDGMEEMKGVNTVHVYVFKRKDKTSYYLDHSVLNTNANGDPVLDANGHQTYKEEEPWPDDMAGFTFDVQNENVVTTLTKKTVDADGNPTLAPDDYTKTTHYHWVAKGTLKKEYGYEYRVVAIAYDSNRRLHYLDYSGSEAEKRSKWCYNTTKDDGHARTLNQDGEQNLFTTNAAADLSLSNFFATFLKEDLKYTSDGTTYYPWWDFVSDAGLYLMHHYEHLSRKFAYPPQLYWGECHAGNDASPIIHYADQDRLTSQWDEQRPVNGLLFRSMAKVEVHVNLRPRKLDGALRYVDWVALCADNVLDRVGLFSYDCFDKPAGYNITQPSGWTGEAGLIAATQTAIGHYDCVDVRPGFGPDIATEKDNNDNNGKEVVLTAYLLPCKTRLAMRVRFNGLITTEVEKALAWGKILVKNAWLNGDPTGVISPDVNDGVFYLHRNHKYVITIPDDPDPEHQGGTNYVYRHPVD